MAYKRQSAQPVVEGGTGVQSNTAYAVLCGGTTSTNPIQSIASVGTAGQVLTSNGAGALPTFQAAAGGITGIAGDSGGTATGPTVTMSGTRASTGASVTFVRSTNTITLSTSDANNNTFIGSSAGGVATSGTGNTAVGSSAGSLISSGLNNTVIGLAAGDAITTGSANTAVGLNAAGALQTGDNCVALGSQALALSTASRNTALGASSLNNITSGLDNTAVGFGAGSSYTTADSSNIIIGSNNSGVAGESSTTRLGSEGAQITCYLAGNVITTTASSGATRSSLVQSTSNTASSQAAVITEVAGGTAGDPYYQARIAGGQNWTWGLDNSDSDAYALSASATLGTTNVMRVSTAGEINYPLQPAFLAYLAATATNVTGNGTVYTLGTAALTEVFDQNGDFNTNGTFTAPVTGRYLLTSNICVTGMTNATTFFIGIVTSNRTYVNYFQRAAGAGINAMIITAIADMEVGDTATTTIQVAGESGDTADIEGGASANTYFCGQLLA